MSANPLVKAQEIMLEYNMPQEQFDRIKAAFEHYDKDQNGAIDASEVLEVMKSCGAEATEADATSFIQSVDVNGNGTIEFWEFVKMMGRKNQKRHHTMQMDSHEAKRRR